jgi:hypothetical protein
MLLCLYNNLKKKTKKKLFMVDGRTVLRAQHEF